MRQPATLFKTPMQVDLYLDAYDRLIANAEFYVTLEPPIDEGEQLDAHMAFMQYWGERRLLGALYQDSQLSVEQARHLASLDQQLLQKAQMIETVYGPSLRDLVRDLYTWGTPLAKEAETVRIETTLATLAELAGVAMGG